MYTNPPLPPPPYQYVPPPPPPPRKSHSGIIVLAIVGSGLFGLLVLVGVVSALGGSGTKPKAAEAAAPSTTTTTRPITTTTSRKDALMEWGQDSMPTIKLLRQDLDDITSAANISDLADLRDACESLGDHATQLRRYLPTPDPAMTVEMEGVADDFELASTTCISASRSLNTSMLKSAISYLESGTQHITNATAILNTYDS